MSENIICLICLDEVPISVDYSDNSNIICKCIKDKIKFHDICLTNWYNIAGRSCPICRTRSIITDNEITNLHNVHNLYAIDDFYDSNPEFNDNYENLIIIVVAIIANFALGIGMLSFFWYCIKNLI